VIVIDDDPTGTQTVSGVRVILRPSQREFAEFFASGEPAAWVLSNSRALPREQAVGLISTIAHQARAAAADADVKATFVLRGDSTLRGHVFAESQALDPDAAIIFVPAFLEGGRVTRDGVHLLATEAGLIPVAQTEFARDPDFGYRSVTLVDWVEEVTDGGYRAACVSLTQLRGEGSSALAARLIAAGAGDVVIPDVDAHGDLTIIADAVRQARRLGARIVVRCAASLAAVLADARPHPVATIAVREPGRVLIVCGSFTEASTRQLHRLGRLWDERIELSPSDATDDPGGAVRRATRAVRQRLATGGVALVTTARTRSAEAGHDVATVLMDALTGIVAAVADEIDVVISKGGITSARVATDGLAASRATVVGQPLPGVALWTLQRPGGALPLVVVPGNVGGDDTLVQLVGRLGGAAAAASTFSPEASHR
jgi:uncharacterized protein YgbK (DUF1537 family)